MFKVYRPDGPHKRMNLPLIDWFVHTKEKLNPYRCQACLTKEQRKQLAINAGVIETYTELNLVQLGLPRPECCRKCGCSF